MELTMTNLEKANQRALIAESMDRCWRRKQKERAEEKKQEIGVQCVVEMASLPGPLTVTWYNPDRMEVPEGKDMVLLEKANQRAMTAESRDRRRRRKQKEQKAEEIMSGEVPTWRWPLPALAPATATGTSDTQNKVRMGSTADTQEKDKKPSGEVSTGEVSNGEDQAAAYRSKLQPRLSQEQLTAGQLHRSFLLSNIPTAENAAEKTDVDEDEKPAAKDAKHTAAAEKADVVRAAE